MDLQSNSIHFITIISSLLLMVPTIDSYSSPEVSHNPMADFYTVTIIPITLNSLNLLGSFYIFYRTYLIWKYDYDKISSLSVRFPFYIAITDFLFSLIILFDFSYTASNASDAPSVPNGVEIVWPSPYCQILGFFNTVFTLLNMLLVGGISIMTWLRVVQEFYFDWGKYDYKVWSFIGIMSFVFPLISIREFGSQTYWCGIENTNSSMISTFLLSIILFTLSTIVFCYTHVLKTIRDIKEDNTSSIVNSEINEVERANIERKILSKVLAYIFVFMFQYIPLMLSDALKLFKVQSILFNALSLSAISIGGVSNLVQYIYNEKFLIFRRFISSNNNVEERINLERVNLEETTNHEGSEQTKSSN